MIIIKMWGGLGNQMFIYALYSALILRGRKVKVDMSYFNHYYAHNGYELERVFGIKVDSASTEECARLANTGVDFASRIMRKLFPLKTHFIPRPEEAIRFFPEIFEMEDVYLQGYWQREEYFRDIRDKILSDFSFNPKLNQESFCIKKKIEATNSVSIHVRRGDYLHKNLAQWIQSSMWAKNTLSGVCTKKYYRGSIDYVESRVAHPTYFIFSNDMSWCNENLKIENAEFVSCNSGEHSCNDMYLMSLCKHNIIANSSFSWWGAWLNKNDDRVVTCPEKWFSSDYKEHCALKEWIKISI